VSQFRDLYLVPTEQHGRVVLPPPLRPPSLVVLSAEDGRLRRGTIEGRRLRFVWLAVYVWRSRDRDVLHGATVGHPEGRLIDLSEADFLSAPEAALRSLDLLEEAWGGGRAALNRFACAAVL
jgi:hypothetical protein